MHTQAQYSQSVIDAARADERPKRCYSCALTTASSGGRDPLGVEQPKQHCTVHNDQTNPGGTAPAKASTTSSAKMPVPRVVKVTSRGCCLRSSKPGLTITTRSGRTAAWTTPRPRSSTPVYVPSTTRRVQGTLGVNEPKRSTQSSWSDVALKSHETEVAG